MRKILTIGLFILLACKPSFYNSKLAERSALDWGKNYEEYKQPIVHCANYSDHGWFVACSVKDAGTNKSVDLECYAGYNEERSGCRKKLFNLNIMEE